MTEHHIHIGGLTALGFDASEHYLLVISHSGRGVFASPTWARVARDPDNLDWNEAHFAANLAPGIGPLSDQLIEVHHFDFDEGHMSIWSKSNRFELDCESSGITIYQHEQQSAPSIAWRKRLWNFLFGSVK